MDRREKLGRHHTIRHTRDQPKDKNNRRLFLFTIAMAVIIFGLTKSGIISPADPARQSRSGASAPPSDTTPRYAQPDDLRAVIDSLAAGTWGPEAVDKIELLAGGQWPESDRGKGARDYVTLLYTGADPNDASEELLRNVAYFLGEVGNDDVPQEALERYKKALSTAYENRREDKAVSNAP